MSTRRPLLLFNPRAGAARSVSADALLAAARSAADPRAELVPLDGAPVAELLAGHDLRECIVVAAGGDGTVRSVAACVAGSGTPFGVIPLGTRNHFARDAGLPSDVPSALAAIARGSDAPVDVGEVAGRIFLNNASLGLYPDFVVERRRRLRTGARWAAVARATGWVLQQRRRLRVRVEGGDERRASILFVGNNEYELQGLRLGRRAALDAGVLTVVLAEPTGPWSVAALVARALLGRLRDARDLVHQHATELRIDIPRSLVRVALDGETTWLAPPLHFRVRPRALVLRTPAPGT